ncbi:hypothetical protein G3A43_08055 [Paraburkholderia aspalathi]|nr:hypothetical protein [Paraburkholderia aspalathi]MBK3780209.1 hypothetical protein [Paraburkholderia aspalathi]
MSESTKYVLYFKGDVPPAEAVVTVLALPGVTLQAERHHKQILLVSCERVHCADLEAIGRQSGWTVSEQRTYRLA